MSTLIEDLKRRIPKLEAEHGSDHPYVKDLKEQLRASEANAGKTADEVYRMQAVQFSPPEKESQTDELHKLATEKGMQSPEFAEAADESISGFLRKQREERRAGMKGPSKEDSKD